MAFAWLVAVPIGLIFLAGAIKMFGEPIGLALGFIVGAVAVFRFSKREQAIYRCPKCGREFHTERW